MASIISAGTSAGTALNMSGDTTGNLAFQTQAGANTITVPNSTGTIITTTGGVAPGTAGNVLTSNGTTWTSAAAGGGGGFPSGTLMLFQQTSAPTGWTKQTTHNNKALRVVSGTAGTGGSVDFTTAFATPAVSGSVSATTLSESQMPSHRHQAAYTAGGGGDPWLNGESSGAPYYTSYTGGNGSHTHSLSGATTTINVSYVDLIIASKD